MRSRIVGIACLYLAGLGIATVLSGCGGGGAASNGGFTPTPTPAPIGSFSLALTQSLLTIAPGANRVVQVQVNSQGGFSGVVSITASALPAGITISPSPLSVNVSGSRGLTITASASTVPGSGHITLQGTSGSLQASVDLPVTINPQIAAADRPFKAVGGDLVRGFYDETRKLLFATNPTLNEVDVISGTDLSIQSRVLIPAPVGIDQMADGTTLVVGTATQALYTIDEATLTVTRHLAPNFSFLSSTTQLMVPVAMANGKVLIIGTEEGIFINYDFGGHHLIQWDSVADTFTELTLSASFPNVGREVDNIKRSLDHKWAILGADQLYLYSSDANAFTSATLPADLRDVAANALGTQFAVSLAQQVNFYDRNLALLGTVTGSQGVFTHTGLRYSSDGTRLYWPKAGSGGTANLTDVLDTAGFSELGHVTNVIGIPQEEPRLFSVDNTQRAFYGSAGGVATIALTALSSGATQSDVNFGFSPSGAPLNVSKSVSFTSVNVPPGISITVAGSPVQIQSFDPNVTAIIPPSAVAGPADMIFTFPDGEAFVKPLSFSYGLTIETPTATLLPTSGNPTIGLLGFGFNDPFNPLPTVTIAGQAAAIALNGSGPSGILQELFVRVPSAPAGPADISASGVNGTTTLAGGLTYVSASIIPASGLIQLMYDPHRNLLYALTSTQVDVLNPTSLQFQAALVPDNTPGVNYVAMALTPDGAKMLLADTTNSTLTVFNPDNPAAKTVTGLPAAPQGVVATATGKAFMGYSQGAIEFDLTTLTSTLRQNVPFVGPLKFAVTPDGTHMVAASLFSTSGNVAAWDSANDSFVSQGFIDGLWSDVTVTNDGTQFAAVAGLGFNPGVVIGFFDEQIHLLNGSVYPDLAPPDAVQAHGGIFSPGGNVLLQPVLDAIEFFDAKSGRLRARMMSPEPVAKLTFPIMSTGTAINPTGQTIYVLSASGITVFQMPTPVDQLAAIDWPL